MVAFRKIILFGGKSLIVSLPKKWVEKEQLHAGDSLQVEERSKQITFFVQPEAQNTPEPKTITYHIRNDSPEVLKRKIISAYITVYDTITLIGNITPEIVTLARETAQQLMALDVIETTNKKVVMHSYLNINEIDFMSILRKIDNSIRSMCGDVIAAVQNRKLSTMLVKDIITRDIDVNKLYFLCLRIISHRLMYQQQNGFHLLAGWELAKTLENIGDDLKRCVAAFMRISPKDNAQLLSHLLELKNIYGQAMTAHYKKDKLLSYTLSDKERAMSEHLISLKNKMKKTQPETEIIELLTHIQKNIFRLTIHYD